MHITYTIIVTSVMHEQNKLANPIYKQCKSIVEGGIFLSLLYEFDSKNNMNGI